MIETKRLILLPLSYEQLIKYISCDNSLEEELNLKFTNRIIPHELVESFETNILPSVADSTKNYLYYTLWAAIFKEDNKLVGDICIVGEPNARGAIEIGYGTYPEFQNKGFMTEIVGGIISWAKTEPKVKSIVADTKKTNLASYKVLRKNNFIRIKETGSIINWELKLGDH